MEGRAVIPGAEENIWIEDATCELCDETALPYERDTEYGWCAEHSMQMYVGAGLEDYIIDAQGEYNWHTYKVHRNALSYMEFCMDYHFDCDGIIVPRLKDPEACPNLLVPTAEICSKHAMGNFGPQPALEPEEWLLQCTPGYEDEDF